MLVSSFKLIRKLLVLAVLLGGLALVGINNDQPVEALRCCTTCDTLAEACDNFCLDFPNHPHCSVCVQQVINCYNHCDMGC
ncbi:MAG TPA: hypothetical protein VGO50_05570 [Pyrinomonadaceae bacterium]|nr:hypothetical protein [Pyrinomonadaceae bacterium]